MTSPAPGRQTQKFLMRRFAEVGIEPKTKHGQNFLIDHNLLGLLAEAAMLGPQDVVLEVGTGTGALTALLATAAAHVVSVEIDPELHQLAREELVDHANVTLLCRDALRNKNHMAPELLSLLEEKVAATPGGRLKLVANLPYNVATPVISNLLAEAPGLAGMTITIQKELADRILARPATKDYGSLSLWVQSQCAAQLVRVLPPTVFWPRPKVNSAIVHLEVRSELRERIADRAYFHDFIRTIFLHRRKLLRGQLAAMTKGELDKPQVDRIIADLGLLPTARAEELDVETMLRLCDEVRLQTSASACATAPTEQ
jgi:16S rRNA (adenine1518-N6/adenine1519-N6)-dimethyltransferase